MPILERIEKKFKVRSIDEIVEIILKESLSFERNDISIPFYD
ncbi:MAG: hypothetical protein ACTSPY_02220 [Candidatus Helarchaeota archaeon]